MYCSNCGVALAQTEKKCPLCGVRAYHPDIPRPEKEGLYPDHAPRPQPKPATIRVLLIALFLIPILVTIQCDLLINSTITWSAYVAGALLTIYVWLILPTWFRKPNPVIFVPCDFAALGLYLLYISLANDGKWFFPFALPTLLTVMVIVSAVITLMRYVPRGRLYIFGGAFLALGLYMPIMETLICMTFAKKFVYWFIYPTNALVVLGGMLIFLAIVRPARETMQRKFFI